MAEDKIILKGMVFYGFHGANPSEREQGQRFVVDLELEADLSLAGATDDLNATANYSRVYRAAKEVVEGPPFNLIEAVAERLAGVLLERFPLETVRVRVNKPWAPVKGSVLETVAVEIVRRRGQ